MDNTVQIEGPLGRGAKAKVQAVLVLGMHRSGTSALTKVLSLLGATLPAQLIAAHPHNPSGFFEPEQIVELHDRLLASAGSSWSDWRQFPRAWYDSHQREEFTAELLHAIKQNFGTSRLFVVKDPRICRFVPLWLALVEQMRAEPITVLPYRNPVEVAKSLAARNGCSSLGDGYLLWLRHLLDAEYDSRGCSRAFLRYEDLVADPRPTIDRLMSALPVAWPRQSDRAFHEVEAFIDPSLRRSLAPTDALNRSDVPDWVRDTYAAYTRLESDANDRVALEKLDEIRAAFDLSANVFSTAFHGIEIQVEEVGRKAALVDHLQAELEELRGQLAAAAPSPDTEAELAALRQRLAAAGNEAAPAAQLASELDGMRGLLAEAERGAARAPDLEAELERLRGRLAVAETEMGRAAELGSELAVARRALADAERGAARAADLEAELATERERHATFGLEAAQVQTLKGELEAARQSLAAAKAGAMRDGAPEDELGSAHQTLAQLTQDNGRAGDLERELKTARHDLEIRAAQIRHLEERRALLRASLREQRSHRILSPRMRQLLRQAYSALPPHLSRHILVLGPRTIE